MSVKWIEYKGKRILYSDYRGLTEELGIENLELEAQMIAASETKALVLNNYEGTTATPDFMKRAKELGPTVTEPNTAKNAALGITGLKELLLRAYNAFTGAKVRPFKTEAEALEWLVQDDEPTTDGDKASQA